MSYNSDNDNHNHKIKKWTYNIENILTEQQNKCAAYKWMHEFECDILSNRNKWLNIINIIIVSFSATGSIITNDLYFNDNRSLNIFNIIYPVFLYITTVISSLQHFLNYQKEAEKHRTASIRYTALYNNIKRMLILDTVQRQQVNNYFTWVNKEYDNIFSSSPDISSSTINKFKLNFNTEISLKTDNTNGKIPEIVISNDFDLNVNKNENDNDNNDEDFVNVNHDVSETEKLKYELDRFMVYSYNC